KHALATEAGDTREIGIDLGTIEFAVAIAISLAHKCKRGSIALSEGYGFRKGDNAVSVGVTSAEGDALGLIAADPLLFGDTPIGVRVGSGEDDEDQILSCLFAREFPVVIGVSKGEVVMRDRDRPRCAECAGIAGAACKTSKYGRDCRVPNSPSPVGEAATTLIGRFRDHCC